MDKQSVNLDLTTGVVWKRLLLFFLPIAAGTCIQQLYNAVDGLIVGRFVGTVALAAVGGSSAQIINLLIGFFVATTAGASVVIAQIYGAGRTEDVRNAAGNAITVFALVGLALMILGLAASPAMLRLLRTPEDTLPYSALYLRIYFLGVPFILVLNMESNMLRSVGDAISPFLFMVVGCVTNIILDVVFVLLFHWGVAGVAIATVVAQIINMILLTLRLMRAKASWRLSFREMKLKGVYLANMFRLGIPAGLQNAMYGVSNMIVQIGVNSLGTVVVASWAMSSKTDGIFCRIHGSDVIVFFFVQHGTADHRSGRYDLDHFTAHNAFGRGRIAGLLANGNFITLFYQPGNISIGRVERDTAHRRPFLQTAVLSGQC